ncbi:MAG TPA: ribosome maturation factor RimM [candidate division Zixibacteria bacterium]|nr:ribosome maturation factor RimM [candidate division Zixibacteria bacterium]
MIDAKTLIAIGKFGRTRGVQGDIYVIPYGDDPTRFERLGEAILEVDSERTTIEIERGAVYSGRPTLKIKGYDTPEAARALTNRELFIHRESLERLPEGRYYAFELEGCNVTDESGQPIGVVTEVESLPANDLLVIEAPDGTVARLPVVSEFIRRVDIAGKMITAAPPTGWREIQ